MGFLSFLFGEGGTNNKPQDPYWQRDPSLKFYRLLAIKPDRLKLGGRGGVFALYHKGVRPGWVYVGATRDLGDAVERMKDHPEVSAMDARGGLFMTWAFIKDDKRDGVVAYLRHHLKPEVDDPDLDREMGCNPQNAKHIPVLLPG
ncbi:hypothetical protein SAMN05421720_101404 [Rhodospira trueperi]|uniref:GIY-YIG domain-containing protein n=2 Tax=Rhodospira trueperi TaxID=69960 RepID=A0A1G6XAM5_9PROT|nr:hypothetical protein SAMN05421720_101404 [Rhodospira trueperi]